MLLKNSRICSKIVIIVKKIPGFSFIRNILFRTETIKRVPTSKFVLSLAISDLLFCLINVPVYGVALNSPNFLNYDNCKLWTFLKCVNSATSIYSKIFITISHWIMICHNSKYDRVSNICLLKFFISRAVMNTLRYRIE